jgi:hypothetical protein
MASAWPGGITKWMEDRTLYLSIPFTWLLSRGLATVRQRSTLWDCAIVGGPAVCLMPGFFADVPWVQEGKAANVLQRVNPHATRTTEGCPNHCRFCAVSRLEPQFRELEDWPDLPILIDNNLLAASIGHLDKVFDRLERWGWADFNQGLDARQLNSYHAERLARIGKPLVRLALDHAGQQDTWERAFALLRKHGIALSRIRSYALIGFDSGPDEAWRRCEWLEGHRIKALPMWFHELDALKPNIVTAKQRELGWTDYERRRIMQWYYQHKKAAA